MSVLSMTETETAGVRGSRQSFRRGWPALGWRTHAAGGGVREIAEAVVMAVALVTAMLNLGAAVLRLLETERGRDRRGRGGRHRR